MSATTPGPSGPSGRQPSPPPAYRRRDRILAGIGAAALALALMALDAQWKEGFVYAGLGAAAVAVCLDELCRTGARIGCPVNKSFIILCGVALFVIHWAAWASPALSEPWGWAVGTLAAATLALMAGRVLRGEVEGTAQALGFALLALAYVPLLLAFLTAVRMLWGVAGLLTVLAVSKFGSTGAFFVGTALGRHKMAPRVSPAKTWEGAVGCLALSTAVAWGLTHTPWAVMQPTAALFYGPLVAAAGMTGDLAASLLKRQASQKDYGHLLPGIGGLLDMADDVLFAAPVSFCFLSAYGHPC